MNTKEIVDQIYKAYGTDSGILLGIKERAVVEAIVSITMNIITKQPAETNTETT